MMTKIKKLPNMAMFVMERVELGKRYTKNEIKELGFIKEKGVKYAIRRLREANVILKIPNLSDMRMVKYHILSAQEIKTSPDIPDPIKLQLANLLPVELSV